LTVVVRDWPLLEPVTVTVYVPAEPEQESVEVCGVGGRVTLAGLRVQVRPAGEAEADRATVPLNPLTPATVIVEVAGTVMLLGLALRVKSVTVTVTVVVRD